MRRIKIIWSICLILLSIWFAVQGVTHHIFIVRMAYFICSLIFFVCLVANFYKELKKNK